MNTPQLISVIIIAFAIGAVVGIVVSNINHNRFLIKRGINPKDFDHCKKITIE